MQVFHDHQHRLPLRLRREPGQQGLQGLLTLPLGSESQGRVVCWQRQGEQGGEQEHDLWQRQARHG
jgi:hypothetical protein